VSTVRDTGLSNERTALGWQRTALSLVVASAVLGRLTFGRIGYVAVGVLALAALMALWVFTESHCRYAQQWGDRQRSRLRSGQAAAWLTLATVLLALTEALALFVRP
jgi:uncharacterized membrane protein YidH (DUF202 family)